MILLGSLITRSRILKVEPGLPGLLRPTLRAWCAIARIKRALPVFQTNRYPPNVGEAGVMLATATLALLPFPP